MATQNNATIILNESIELMKKGIIGTTGRTITVTVKVNGKDEKQTFQEPEPIHTFQDWKTRGFIVKKGEKAIASFTIWNYHNNKKTEDDEPEGLVKSGYYYMKKAAFFKYSQVKPINGPDDPKDPAPAAKPAPVPEAKEAPAPVKEAKPAAGRKAPKTDTQKAFDFIVKSCAKEHKNGFAFKSGSFDGITYATDGFQVIRTAEALEAEALEAYEADQYKRMFANYKAPEKSGSLNFTAKELKEGIKAAKAGRRNAKVIYTTSEGIALNANYLLNALIATGSTGYKYSDPKWPVIFENDSTLYMLLPVHIKNDSFKAEGFHTIG